MTNANESTPDSAAAAAATAVPVGARSSDAAGPDTATKPAGDDDMAWHREGQRDAAFRRARLEEILVDDLRTVTLGMQITRLDAERIVIEQTVGPDDVNGVNICHGGVIFTLADSASGIGANSLDVESAWVTVTSEIHFRSPARIGERLVATCELAEVVSARRRLFQTIVTIDDPDAPGSEPRVVATVDSVFVRLRELPS